MRTGEVRMGGGGEMNESSGRGLGGERRQPVGCWRSDGVGWDRIGMGSGALFGLLGPGLAADRGPQVST